MENELECLGDRKGHLAKKFLKKYYSSPQLSRLPCRDLLVIIRQQRASNKCVYLKTEFLNLKSLSNTV